MNRRINGRSKKVTTDWYSRWEASHSPDTAPEMLMRIANESSENSISIDYHLARNPNTPVEVLVKLAENEDGEIQYWVARHPNTPAAVKLWIETGGYAGMSLTEFLEKIYNDKS